MKTVGNYLDGIAIGVRQGFYDEAVVRDHLEAIMRDHTKEFLSPEMRKAMDLGDEDFSQLTDLISSWKPDKPYFRFWRR